MKGIYISNYDLSNEHDGVSKKINAQIRTFEQAGAEMTVFDINNVSCRVNGFAERILLALMGNSGPDMRELIGKAHDAIKSASYDFLYVRKSFLDKKQVDLLSKIKRDFPNVKILLELPTYPYDNEVKFRKRPLLSNDIKARKKLKSCLDRVVTFSKDDSIFGVPTINIMNGVMYDDIVPRVPETHDGINLIAVAFFAHWHGYDRIIKGMAKELDVVKENNLHLHLVGTGGSLKEYMEMVSNYSLTNYVHFHGKKHGEELSKLYRISDIALDSMGRHRVNVYFNSTLKGKEYCAFGMPIISGVETELDGIENYKYYYRVPANDSNISIKNILGFYHSIYDGQETNEIVKEITNISKMYFDLKYTFSPVIEYILA